MFLSDPWGSSQGKVWFPNRRMRQYNELYILYMVVWANQWSRYTHLQWPLWVYIGMCDSGEYWRQGKQLLNLDLRERCVLVEGYIPTCIKTQVVL